MDAKYLDDGQIDYEIELRRLELIIRRDSDGSLTESELIKLNNEIQRDPYLPLSIIEPRRNDPDSDPNEKKEEVKLCRAGAQMLRDLSDTKQILHRAMHLFYRLKRIHYGPRPELEEKKKSIYDILKRAIVDSVSKIQLEQSFESAPRAYSGDTKFTSDCSNFGIIP